MSGPRPHDGTCELTVQPTVSTLHIPASHAFIPFQQFSLSDGTGLRNPADDNNNKTAVPVVSVVAAVSGLCPALPVVSMQQQAQLPQAVVAPTIIPTVVAPMAVQTANGLTPTTTMTMSNAININSHLSVATPQQQQQHQQQALSNTGISLSTQTTGMSSNISTPINTSLNGPLNLGSNAPQNSVVVPTGAIKPNNSNNSTISVATNNSNNNNNIPAKPSSSNNNKSSSTSSTSSQSSNSNNSSGEQTDDLVKPVFKDGELVLEVECGQNKAILYLSKLCQGSKGPCISFQNSWLTPNEFQFVSGRETAKDWKRSIRHHGKSLKLLLAKGILTVHPTMCDCDGCRQGATLTRKGEKRRIPNGERRPRKPSSTPTNGVSEGHVAGGFRPLGATTMAAHLVSPGGAPAKPEVKRSAGDKPKTADAAAQSPLRESNVNLPRAGLITKTVALARPDSLNAASDNSKPRPAVSSTSSAPSSPASTTSTPTPTPTPPQLHSSSAPTTPNRAPSFPAVSAAILAPRLSPSSHPTTTTTAAAAAAAAAATVTAALLGTTSTLATAPSTAAPSAPAPSAPATATTALPQPAVPSLATAVSTAPATADNAQPGPSTSSSQPAPESTPLVSPNLPGSTPAQIPPASSSCDPSSTPALPSSPAEDGDDGDDEDDEDDDNDVNMTASGNEETADVSDNESEANTDDESEEEEGQPEMSSKVVSVAESKEASPLDTSDRIQAGTATETLPNENQDISQETEEPAKSAENSPAIIKKEEVEEPEPMDVKPEIPKTVEVAISQNSSSSSSSSSNTTPTAADNHLVMPPSSVTTAPTPLSPTSTATTSTTRLAVSAIQGPCSQPLSVSVSVTNVKSEHIWVPPTLSPAHENRHLHQPHLTSSNSSSTTTTTNTTTTTANNINIINNNNSSSSCNNTQKSPLCHKVSSAIDNSEAHRRDPPAFVVHSTPDKDKPATVQPLEMTKRLSEATVSGDVTHHGVKVDSGASSGNHAKSRPFQSIERHFTNSNQPSHNHQMVAAHHQNPHHQSAHHHSQHHSGTVHKEKEVVKKEHVESKSAHPGMQMSLERQQQREREERQRQKMREERNRKDREREERNRRERERESERREEKEAERRRQEEKERRDLAKAQAEGVAGRERLSATTPVPTSLDASRRPPGGVAEAAAFSDYMRVLAAGHGHTFMPTTPNYMPSLFPIRPQDPTPLPAHLLHPLSSAYGAQLSGLPKEPMLYPSTSGPLTPYATPLYSPLHPFLQRAQLAGQGPSLLDYQRSVALSYAWPSAYPYLVPEAAAATSSTPAAAGVKRPAAAEMEAALENAKRARLEGRAPEYSSPWDYFAAAAAASQQPRLPMPPTLPCGMESANLDKTAEYLRRRYLEYGPQAAAYLSALPEYARAFYHCTCSDHRDEDIRMWGVDDVCKFLNSLDGCGIYAEHFREQRVDGRILAVLGTEHLVKTLGMKLGPAVLLSEAVAKKLQDISKLANCEACRSIALSQPGPPMAMPL